MGPKVFTPRNYREYPRLKVGAIWYVGFNLFCAKAISMFLERNKQVRIVTMVFCFHLFLHSAKAEKKDSMDISEIHRLTEKMVNYSPDSCLVLLDLASGKIAKVKDEELAASYLASNNLRRADFWVFDDIDKAEVYLEKAYDYYIEHVDNKKLAEIYCLKAQVVKIRGGMQVDAIQKSIPYFDKAVEYALQQDNPSTKAFIFYEKAITLQQTERWHESLETALQNLHYAELSADSLSICMAYFLMGRTYNYFGFGDYAETNMAMSIAYGKGMALLYSVIHTYANTLEVNGKTRLALENYEVALDKCQKLKRWDQVLRIYTSMGRLQLREGRYADALKSLDSINVLKPKFDKVPAETMLFEAQMHRHNREHEMVYNDLQSFKETYGTPRMYAFDIDVYKGVADLYSALGMHQDASDFYKSWGSLKDSLQLYTNKGQLEELKKLYLNERARNDEILLKNEELKESRKSQANLGAVLIVLLAVGGGLTFYIRMRVLKNTQKLKLDFKAKQLEQLIEVQETERQRIARELHDGVGQSLAALKIQLQFDDAPNAAEHTVNRVDALCKEVRTLSHQMMPVVLRENGLKDAMEQLLKSSFASSEVEADIVSVGLENRLPDKVEVHLYRIAQELMSNIIKHAGAAKVGVQLLLRKDAVILIVEDDGVGFEKENNSSDGIGLSNIYSRVEALAGAMQVRSSGDGGTCVHITIPLEANESKKTA